MRAHRIRPLLHAALALAACAALASTRARAQDDGDPLPPSEHPGSDSPESVEALARSSAGHRRAQAFLIPLDEKARAPTGRVAQALERALAGARQYEVVDLAKALASDAEPMQEEKAALGRKLLAEANRSYAVHAYAESVPKFKAAIKGLAAGLAALDEHEMADAYLRLAAAQQLSGEAKEVKAARESYVTAALLDPQQKLQATSVDPIAEQPLLLARGDLDQIPIGKLELETRPAGARVLIDGQPQGATPTRVELTGGKHLLRLERTGFYPTAELIDVASRRDTLYSVTLSATPGAATLNQMIAGAADEASHGRAGEKMQALANRFHLERLLVGSVASHGLKISVLLALADPASGQLLGREELLLTADGTDADQVEFDTQEAARKLLDADDAAPHSAAPSAPAAASAPIAPAPDFAAPSSPDSISPAPSESASSTAAPAPLEGPRRAVMPGAAPPAPPPPDSAPTADDPGLVGRDRAVPLSSPAPFAPAGDAPSSSAQAADAPAATPAQEKKKKKKEKDLHAKSGTEGWDSN